MPTLSVAIKWLKQAQFNVFFCLNITACISRLHSTGPFTYCDHNLSEIRKEKSINIKLKMYQKKELEQRTKELEECKAQNDLERKRLMDEIEEVCKKFLGAWDILGNKSFLFISTIIAITNTLSVIPCNVRMPVHFSVSWGATVCVHHESRLLSCLWLTFSYLHFNFLILLICNFYFSPFFPL